MSISVSWYFLAASALCLLAMCWWFIYRVKFRQIWLPTLRVLDLRGSRMRRLRMRRPPWLAFLMYTLAASAFIFFTLRPQRLLPLDTTKKPQTVHIFLDLSPSAAARVTLDQYLERMVTLWNSLGDNVSVSASTSHSAESIRINNLGEFLSVARDRGFHRFGVRIASAVNVQKDRFSNAKSLIIVSDGEKGSWRNFEWQYFGSGLQVYYFSITTSTLATLHNVYVLKADLISVPGGPVTAWDISIERTAIGRNKRGHISLILGGKTIDEQEWEFEGRQTSTIVRLSAKTRHIMDPGRKGLPLVVSLAPKTRDALAMDNAFKISRPMGAGDVLLVGAPYGEREIEDSLYPLRAALRVASFSPKRWDGFAPGVTSKNYPFVILNVDEAIKGDRQCPFSKLASGHEKKNVWLMPRYLGTSYKNLCRCFFILSEYNNHLNICKQASSLSSVTNIFDSIGIKRLGGDIRSLDQALGWYERSKGGKGISVTMFMIPMRPDRRTGIDNATFPLLINQLLVWEGMISGERIAKRTSNVWAGVDDATREKGWSTATLASHILESNVSLAESKLLSVASDQLPSVWQKQDNSRAGSNLTESKKDPLPWIKLCWIVIITLMLLEATLNRQSFWRYLGRNLCILIAFGSDVKVEASVQIVVLGKNSYSSSVGHLADIVSSRSSLELRKSLRSIDPEALVAYDYPWLWTNKKEILAQANPHYDQLLYWLQSGGFLIAQNVDTNKLERLMNLAHFPERYRPSWMPISPDHELMRSFYLLDALPTCNGQLWHGLIFDGRIAALAVPFDFIQSLQLNQSSKICDTYVTWEERVRILINILMVVMTTDYKKDQIHMKSILKRLR